MATTAVLFRNADRPMTGGMMCAIARCGDLTDPRMRRVAAFRRPVSTTPAATTNKAPMVKTASLANPANACSGVIIPTSANMPIAPRKMMSIACG